MVQINFRRYSELPSISFCFYLFRLFYLSLLLIHSFSVSLSPFLFSSLTFSLIFSLFLSFTFFSFPFTYSPFSPILTHSPSLLFLSLSFSSYLSHSKETTEELFIITRWVIYERRLEISPPPLPLFLYLSNTNPRTYSFGSTHPCNTSFVFGVGQRQLLSKFSLYYSLSHSLSSIFPLFLPLTHSPSYPFSLLLTHSPSPSLSLSYPFSLLPILPLTFSLFLSLPFSLSPGFCKRISTESFM